MKLTDPMVQATPKSELELFRRFGKEANGFTQEQVMGAALNLIVNALRQRHDKRKGAFEDYEQLTTKARGILAAHYDSLGKRRNVFPFHQTIEMPMFDARPKDIKPN